MVPASQRRARLWVDRLHAHQPHQAPHTLGVDRTRRRLCQRRRPARHPVDRRAQARLVDQPHQPHVPVRFAPRLVVPRRPVQAQPFARPAQTQGCRPWLDQPARVVSRRGSRFFSPTPGPSSAGRSVRTVPSRVPLALSFFCLSGQPWILGNAQALRIDDWRAAAHEHYVESRGCEVDCLLSQCGAFRPSIESTPVREEHIPLHAEQASQ